MSAGLQDARLCPRAGGVVFDQISLEPHLANGRVRLGDAAHEQFHRPFTQGALVATDGGQGHGQVDLGLHVVKSDDADVLGHAHAAGGKRVKHLPGHVV